MDTIQIVADDYWTDYGLEMIQKTAEIFQHYSFAGTADTTLDGAQFGLADFVFNLHFAGNGKSLDIQLCSKKKDCGYMFGLCVYENDIGEKHGHVYHNPYGPFPMLYEQAYEK